MRLGGYLDGDDVGRPVRNPRLREIPFLAAVGYRQFDIRMLQTMVSGILGLGTKMWDPHACVLGPLLNAEGRTRFRILFVSRD